VSGVLLRRTLVTNRWRVAIVGAGLALWGFLLPVIYATFGADFRRLVDSGLFAQAFEAFSAFTGGSIFTLNGSVALGFIHPIAIALVAALAIGYPVAAIAGERQRGTLEVLLARPISRRDMYRTALGSTVLFVALALAANLAGVVAGAALFGVGDELDHGRLLLAWANAVLLFAALGSIALAASASFDRLLPALGAVIGFAIVSYAVEFLGALWPDIAWLRPWSVFHYFQPAEILGGDAATGDLAVLAVVVAASATYGLWIFPRRDIAAPS